MVDHNLIADLGIDPNESDAMIRASLGEEVADGNMDSLIQADIQQFSPGSILKGRFVGKAGDDAVIDVGLKSEGLIHKSEFDDWDTLESGAQIEVVLEDLRSEEHTSELQSRRKLVCRLLLEKKKNK